MSTHNPEQAARRRLWIGIAAIAAALLAAGGIVAYASYSLHPKPVTPQAPKPFTPAEPTTAQPAPNSAPSATTATASPTPSEPGTVTIKTTRKGPAIAFRIGFTIYVADEDGSNAAPVAQSTQGPYALSPDGRTLAYIEGSTGALYFVDLARAQQTGVEQDLPMTPVWAPDSSAVYVVRGPAGSSPSRIARIPRSGASPTIIADGGTVAVSPDGHTVVIGPVVGASGAAQRKIVVYDTRNRSQHSLTAQRPVTAVAGGNGYVYLATEDSVPHSSIWRMKPDGSQRKVLRSVDTSPVASDVTVLLLSPSGSWLAYAATGDDGYSRASVIPAAGGAHVVLSQRRDTYPAYFSAKSAWIYFIEGNGFQSESTALYRMHPTGTSKRMVVSGATQ